MILSRTTPPTFWAKSATARKRSASCSAPVPTPTRTGSGARSTSQHKEELQVELLKVQNWVKQTGERIVVLCEGRDAAGKGGTIKRFMEHLNPRAAQVIALEKPTERERGQWYFQRYVEHLPSRGEMVFFDRSWYNRAGVERVMGFCSSLEYLEFMRQVPDLERMLARSGIRLFKYWFSVTRDEQSDPFHGPRGRSAETMEAQSDRRALPGQVARVHGSQGGHVLLHGHGRCALDDRKVRRQEARTPELHAAFPVRAGLSREGQARRSWSRSANSSATPSQVIEKDRHLWD